MLQDLKYAAKLLWKDKGFTLTAIATLAICIGANAAIFSVVHSVVLSPLPVPESDRIVLMYNSYPKAGAERAASGVPDHFDRLAEMADVFEEQALYRDPAMTIGGKDRPERVDGMEVTPSFFRLLRVGPRLGRVFTDDEGEIGAEKKTVLSYALWQQLYGGDESALGRDLRINDEPYTVVGVMPEDFLYIDPDIRLWIPAAFTEEQKSQRHNNTYESIGRLKNGATLGEVRARLDSIAVANDERFPEFKEILANAGYHVQAHFLKDELVRDIRATLYLLWAGVFFVLLIGAVNITNLMMVRSSVRAKELSMRFALGAGRGRVLRQLLTESTVLGILGGFFGLLVGHISLNLLRTLGLNEIPRGSEIAMTGVVIVSIVGLSFVLGILLGLIPFLQTMRMNVNATLREEGRTGTTSRGARVLRNVLVAAQVAFAFLLLMGAGLMLTSFREVLTIDPGFRDGETVLTGRLNPPSKRYEERADLRSLAARLLERVRAIPGVAKAGVASAVPFGNGHSSSIILAEGYVMDPGESFISPYYTSVSAGYFESMGISLREGRLFEERDNEESSSIIIVDERLARKFWPDESALGKRLFFPTNEKDLLAITEETEFFTVVGVVDEVKRRALVDTEEAVGAYYFPFQQRPTRGITLTVKTATEPTSFVGSIRRQLAEIDPELPLYGIRTMQELLDDSLQSRRSPMFLFLVFGGLALFLASVGLYGVLAYLVTSRTKEIGIRMAIGSDPAGIFRLILKEGVVILAVGFVLGVASSFALARFIASLLFGVQPLDGGVMASVGCLLVLVALAACSVPALRATRIHPVEALRAE
jgi:predicted permease